MSSLLELRIEHSSSSFPVCFTCGKFNLVMIYSGVILVDEIDLLNVSFDGSFAPDRISARAGLKELQKIAPSRRYPFPFLLLFVPLATGFLCENSAR